MNNQNIHIVYIITKLELGGAQKVCLSLFNGVQQLGCSAELITGDKGILTEKVRNLTHVTLLPLMTANVSFKGILSEVRNFWHLMRQLRMFRNKYPNLIVHTHSTKAGLLGRWAAFFAGVSTRVHTIHGYAFHQYQSKITWFVIYMCEFITSFITTHYICVSAKDVAIGIALFPRFFKKHSIIRAAVDVQQFYIPARIFVDPSMKKSFVFGTVSCFKPQKNLFDLLRAFERVYEMDSRARLELIGDGHLRASIEQWIESKRLSHVITLHGWQYAVAPIMRTWHVFVLSSLWEGLPCAVVEARLSHLPVVSYRTGGIYEVVIDQENGLLCKPGDWQELARNMERLMREPDFYQLCQKYPDNLGDFDTNFMVNEHVFLYEKLCKKRLFFS